jgi:hypothetical protein
VGEEGCGIGHKKNFVSFVIFVVKKRNSEDAASDKKKDFVVFVFFVNFVVKKNYEIFVIKKLDSVIGQNYSQTGDIYNFYEQNSLTHMASGVCGQCVTGPVPDDSGQPAEAVE